MEHARAQMFTDEWTREQCDQMDTLFVNIRPFAAMKICPMT